MLHILARAKYDFFLCRTDFTYNSQFALTLFIQGRAYKKNIVPIASAVQFVRGQQQWRLLMPSSPFVASVDILAGHELSFAYGYEQYWAPWCSVKRDGRGAKISRETKIKQRKSKVAKKRKGQKRRKPSQAVSTRLTRSKHK